MKKEEMEEVEFFKGRPLGTEEKGFIITAGNMMASKKTFKPLTEAAEQKKKKQRQQQKERAVKNKQRGEQLPNHTEN